MRLALYGYPLLYNFSVFIDNLKCSSANLLAVCNVLLGDSYLSVIILHHDLAGFVCICKCSVFKDLECYGLCDNISVRSSLLDEGVYSRLEIIHCMSLSFFGYPRSYQVSICINNLKSSSCNLLSAVDVSLADINLGRFVLELIVIISIFVSFYRSSVLFLYSISTISCNFYLPSLCGLLITFNSADFFEGIFTRTEFVKCEHSVSICRVRNRINSSSNRLLQCSCKLKLNSFQRGA